MAVEQKKILIRRGNKADLVLTDLQPGEQALALDTNEVGIKTSGGDMIWYAHADDLAAHAARTDNPHSVSAAQIGAVLASEKGKANGVPTLNADGKVVQEPANKGVANGVASLGSDGIVPTAQTGVVSGSNSNGNYIKFPDGTLICYGHESCTVANTNGITVTFPTSFIDTGAAGRANYTFIGNVVSGIDYPTVYADNIYLTSTNVWLSNAGSSVAGNNIVFTWVAIGRWK